MARKLRDDFKGAWHHVMHRGARRHPIFVEDADCAVFLGLIDDVVRRFGVEVHGFALMPNHYHLLVRSIEGNLSRSMKHLNQLFTQFLNRRHNWDGPVFRGRFRSELVREEWQLPYVLAYIHLNPLKAGLVTKLNGDWWTSHTTYMGSTTYSDWLTTGYFEELFGSPDALEGYMLDLHRGVEDWPEAMELTSGLFQSRQLISAPAVVSGGRNSTSGQEILDRVCRLTGAIGTDLQRAIAGPRANPARRFAVWALKNYTGLSHKEIGHLLKMSTAQVANVLGNLRRNMPPELAKLREEWRDEFNG